MQLILDRMAERQAPVIEMVGDRPIVLNAALTAAEKALVLLTTTTALSRFTPSETGLNTATRRVGRAMSSAGSGRPARSISRMGVHLLTPGTIEAERLVAFQVRNA